MRHLATAALLLLAAAGTSCADRYAGAGALEAERAMLEREVGGLRESAKHLYGGDPIFPASDVLIAIDESVVEGLIGARLPLVITAAPYTITLTSADVGFAGAPTVRLRGTLARDGVVNLAMEAGLIGALTGIEIDTATSTLRAVISADHVDITSAAGIETLLSDSSLDDAALVLREQIARQLPTIEIPVRVQDEIDIPAITDGPVRLEGVRLPIKAAVSRVVAVERRLWVSLHFDIGQLTRRTP